MMAHISIDGSAQLAYQIGSQRHATCRIIGIEKSAEAIVDLAFQIFSDLCILPILADKPANERAEFGIERILLFCMIGNALLSKSDISIHHSRRLGSSCHPIFP